jgi:hypothetical protein
MKRRISKEDEALKKKPTHEPPTGEALMTSQKLA